MNPQCWSIGRKVMCVFVSNFFFLLKCVQSLHTECENPPI